MLFRRNEWPHPIPCLRQNKKLCFHNTLTNKKTLALNKPQIASSRISWTQWPARSFLSIDCTTGEKIEFPVTKKQQTQKTNQIKSKNNSNKTKTQKISKTKLNVKCELIFIVIQFNYFQFGTQRDNRNQNSTSRIIDLITPFWHWFVICLLIWICVDYSVLRFRVCFFFKFVFCDCGGFSVFWFFECVVFALLFCFVENETPIHSWGYFCAKRALDPTKQNCKKLKHHLAFVIGLKKTVAFVLSQKYPHNYRRKIKKSNQWKKLEQEFMFCFIWCFVGLCLFVWFLVVVEFVVVVIMCVSVLFFVFVFWNILAWFVGENKNKNKEKKKPKTEERKTKTNKKQNKAKRLKNSPKSSTGSNKKRESDESSLPNAPLLGQWFYFL